MKTTFEDIYNRYHQDLFQYIFYMVKDKSLAEDLIQEVYIKVLKSYDSFRGESSEKTWLFSIARHTTMDSFRKQTRNKQRLIDFLNFNKQASDFKDTSRLPEEIVILDEELKDIYYQLDKCSLDQKQVLILRYLQSLTIQETADIMGCSTSKVKTTQHRAIKKLQTLLRDQQERG
ncbi:sigma-70 family RNA polymerase sigma factor [Paraliobacillus sp. X-1268]|uniref:sigma-70 family RNA polymerase sigma factor n=1 Tax=Paraliobacillus sp. X-1268 TaxID=2213193 RepID=UPI000E3C7774|nr:sigma-70 family RNA polymerase sigma factor [Paraliobacillus sp. X-1268]